MAEVHNKYASWDRESLIARIQTLENQLDNQKQIAEAPKPAPSKTDKPWKAADAPPPPPPKKRKKQKEIDPSQYSTRFIALKLAYLGKQYGGFEYAESAYLPTIEGELWKALTKACLIFPEDANVVNFDCCEYSKCGRTDRGVSAFGQVIGLRVRSNKPLPKPEPVVAEGENADTPMEGTAETTTTTEKKAEEKEKKPAPEWTDDREIDYIRTLNRLLPDDIRILAWCPSPPPDFSARFSCEERQYRYFFTQPAFAPTTGTSPDGGLKEGYLDIEAMNDAARRFVGNHDFRNFCKVDGGKQISNFERAMFEAGVEEVRDVGTALPYLGLDGGADGGKLPKVYSFNIRGTAFLWHQIRHIVSILFLIGQRLEKPELVTELLDVEKAPRKPNYDLACDTPLVLWNCVFPGDKESRTQEGASALKWVYGGADIMESMWKSYRVKKMDELLANRLLDLVSGQVQEVESPPKGTRVFQGGPSAKLAGEYVPIMKKRVTGTPAEINDKFAQRKGFKNSEEMKETKNWRKVVKDAKEAKRAAAADDADE